MNLDIFQTAVEIVKKLQDNGYSAYIVGGTVRDYLMGKSLRNINPGNDVDIATSAKPENINQLFDKTYNIGAAFGIVNVIKNETAYEVATFREESQYNDGRHPEKIEYTESPKRDALRRDFTINAIFYDPIKETFQDFVGGKQDIKDGLLRTIGNPDKRFNEDYLRILRAIRFSTKFGFKIAPSTFMAINKFAKKIVYLSKERVRDELNKMFTGPSPGKALQLLSDTGILSVVLPEIEAMRGITQPKAYHPEGDVFEHTKLMLSKMVTPNTELAWSILLHDVGKPLTLEFDENSIERFYCHAEKGAEIAENILKRLKFTNASISKICFAVKNHMRYACIKEMRTMKLKRLIAEPTFPIELELHRLDCLCSNKITDNFIFLLDTVHRQNGETKLPPPLITGKDLISLGYRPGPEFGNIISQIEEKQIEKVINTKDEAMAWIAENFEL